MDRHLTAGFLGCSNVDGFNLPLSITPKGNFKLDPTKHLWCLAPTCRTNILNICPPELQQKNSQGKVVGCKSGCVAFNQPQYCCIGPNGTPDTCPPTSYSKIFKDACPDAYSYPYDDPTSFYSCDSVYQLDYDITFCP
jgi:Thaumatin family